MAKPTGNPNGRPPHKEPRAGYLSDLKEYHWRALERESEGFDPSLEGWPSRTKAIDVATACGKSDSIVSRWRKECSWYRAGLKVVCIEKMAKKICARLENDDRNLAEDLKRIQTNHTNPRSQTLKTYALIHWPGKIQPPGVVDPSAQVFTTPNDYVSYLEEHSNSGSLTPVTVKFRPQKYLEEVAKLRKAEYSSDVLEIINAELSGLLREG